MLVYFVFMYSLSFQERIGDALAHDLCARKDAAAAAADRDVICMPSEGEAAAWKVSLAVNETGGGIGRRRAGA